MKTIEKECKYHGLTEYRYDKSNKRNVCKKCASQAVQRRRDKVKQMAVEYLGGKCNICGYDKCLGALDFHHRDSNKKDFGISHKGYTRSWEKVKKELDKCDLLCSNCHREKHWNEDRSQYSVESKQRIEKEIKCNCCNNYFVTKEKNRKYCSQDCSKSRYKNNKPSKEQLLKDFNELRFATKVAKKYGVSDTTVRNWVGS